ncbi:hypothetical protein BJ741DRAFT_172937 [Chytriomyces cf. hyalinus JEL632]|nr:hypothetical protein BJ741DRAFT_172937 [Chytriomyces cf. hyalinus JEL632]
MLRFPETKANTTRYHSILQDICFRSLCSCRILTGFAVSTVTVGNWRRSSPPKEGARRSRFRLMFAQQVGNRMKLTLKLRRSLFRGRFGLWSNFSRSGFTLFRVKITQCQQVGVPVDPILIYSHKKGPCVFELVGRVAQLLFFSEQSQSVIFSFIIPSQSRHGLFSRFVEDGICFCVEAAFPSGWRCILLTRQRHLLILVRRVWLGDGVCATFVFDCDFRNIKDENGLDKETVEK